MRPLMMMVVLALTTSAPVLGLSEEGPAAEPRAITLEMTGASRSHFDGEDVREPPADQASAWPTANGALSAHLAHDSDTIVFDADFDGSTSAVAWRALLDPTRTLHLATSHDARLGDFTIRDVASDARGQSVAVCGTDVVVAYHQRAPDNGQRLQLTLLPGDGAAGSSSEIRAPVEKRGTIDVACTAERAYVAWTEQIEGRWHALVRSVSLPDLEPTQVHAAGPAKRYRIALAASDDEALLVWQDRTRIRLGRLRVGPDDGQLLSPSTGTIARHGRNPVIDADGVRVVVGFDRGNHYFILASRNGGRAFDRRARFDRPVRSGPQEITSLAVRGRDVVATIIVYYGGDAWDRHRLRSPDRGKTWARSRIGHPTAAIAQDGFLATPGGVKVAEAYTDGIYADQYDLRVRRER